MANSTPEPSSSLSITSSSVVSNGSSAQAGTSLEIVSLSRLSCNLERLLIDQELDCSDADVVPADGAPVGVHRCILAARSPFFRELFARNPHPDGRPRYVMSELVPQGKVGREAFMAFLSYLYTGKLRPAPVEVSTCVDHMCAHDACRPAINFVVELMYASSVFQIPELVSLFQRRLHNFVDKALVEDVMPILMVAFDSKRDQLLAHCIQRVARSDMHDTYLEKELPHEVVEEIKSVRKKSKPEDYENVDPVHEKRVRRIHRALDSDDVELVKLLLSESEMTLDDAYALHYAAAYCDSKVVSEVLDLGLANVNLKDSRGYTPLHMAAMRMLPAVIVSLLSKGASATDTTDDGRNAVSICRRLTRLKDFREKTEQCQEANKDRICIEILEREIRRNPHAVQKSITSPLLADGLHMKLLYLENRVAFARLFFPLEAKVAMEIANVDNTTEFAGHSTSQSSRNLREVDLNETPAMRDKRLQLRVDALARTVEYGRRYFPNCSEVLDKFMEDDLPDLFFLQKGTPDEQKIKRARFCELKEVVLQAFNKDKAQRKRSGLSSSSSSSSSIKGDMKQQKAARKEICKV